MFVGLIVADVAIGLTYILLARGLAEDYSFGQRVQEVIYGLVGVSGPVQWAPETRGDLFNLLTSALGIFTLLVTAYLFLRPAEPRGPAGPRRRRPDQGTAGQAGGPGLARLLRAARRQERDLVPDRQGRRLLPRGVRRDAGQRRPDRRSGGLARRDRPVPGRGGAARLGAGRDGLQRARRRGVVPRGRPDRARTRRRGHRQHGRLQPVRAADAERQADGQPGGQARLRGRGPPGGRHTAGRTRRHHQGRRLLARQPDRARLLDGARPDRHARRRGVRARHRDRGRRPSAPCCSSSRGAPTACPST